MTNIECYAAASCWPAGAVPPEVVEALRAAQQRGQLPGNLAGLVAQLQRQQAARRAEARRARGFQIHINLGRINMRAIMQLVFMVIIMAPVSREGC